MLVIVMSTLTKKRTKAMTERSSLFTLFCSALKYLSKDAAVCLSLTCLRTISLQIHWAFYLIFFITYLTRQMHVMSLSCTHTQSWIKHKCLFAFRKTSKDTCICKMCKICRQNVKLFINSIKCIY